MMMNADDQIPVAPYGPAPAGTDLKSKLLLWLMLGFAPMGLYQSGAIVALLFALVVACIWALPDRRWVFAADADRLGLWWLLALLGYGLLSVSWARDSREAFYDWWRIALILGSGWLLLRCVSRLDPAHSRYLLQGVLWGAVVLIISLLVEWLGDGQFAAFVKDRDTSGLLYTSRACAILAVLLWPLSVYGRYRLGKMAAAVLLLLALIVIGALPLLAAGVAVLASSAVFLCHRAWPCITPRILGGVFIAAVLLAPLAGLQAGRYVQSAQSLPQLERLPGSWLHRLVIWEFFAQRIEDSPWLGYGLGSAHGMGEVPTALKDYQRIAGVLGNVKITADPPLHPHNAALQLWHDLGLAGVLGACAWWVLGMRSVLQGGFERSAVAATLAAMTAWSVIAGLSFGLWQKWWLASGGIALAICMLLLRGLEAEGNGADA